MASGAFTPSTVTLIERRDEGRCAWCGHPIIGDRGIDWSVHHREPRGMGGASLSYVAKASNGVLVHGHGTDGCHGRIERRRAVSTGLGFLVSRTRTYRPNVIPIQHAVHGWCVLTDDGDVIYLKPLEVTVLRRDMGLIPEEV